MDNLEIFDKDGKALHIAFVVCSFIPFWGITIAWHKHYRFIKKPLFLLYHLITLCIVFFLLLKQLIESV